MWKGKVSEYFYQGVTWLKSIFKRPIWLFLGREIVERWGKRQWNNTKDFSLKKLLSLLPCFPRTILFSSLRSPQHCPALCSKCSWLSKAPSSLLTKCYFIPSSTLAQLLNCPFATSPLNLVQMTLSPLITCLSFSTLLVPLFCIIFTYFWTSSPRWS